MAEPTLFRDGYTYDVQPEAVPPEPQEEEHTPGGRGYFNRWSPPAPEAPIMRILRESGRSPFTRGYLRGGYHYQYGRGGGTQDRPAESVPDKTLERIRDVVEAVTPGVTRIADFRRRLEEQLRCPMAGTLLTEPVVYFNEQPPPEAVATPHNIADDGAAAR